VFDVVAGFLERLAGNGRELGVAAAQQLLPLQAQPGRHQQVAHDAPLQEYFNRFMPVQVFNLSITRPEIIEETHRRMAAAYHPKGGPWKREYMPRTVFVFLNAQPHLSPERQRVHAKEEAEAALGAYWAALDGTIDPSKVANAADNALIGNPDDIAAQILERFHPEDRLMLWFDFFNHDCARVIVNQEAFMARVVPVLRSAGLAC
jgi:hypothetical protein